MAIFNVICFSGEFSLVLICLIGDYYIFESKLVIDLLKKILFFKENLLRALMDNASHGLIGLISWLVVSYPNTDIYELIASGAIASFIDLDHFISARSLYLSDATSLSTRPFLHNSLTMIILNVIIYAGLSVFYPEKRYWAVLFFVSWFSHHVRDANRRGLWFGPIYTTSPLKKPVYFGLIALAPLALRFFYNDTKNLFDFRSNLLGMIRQKNESLVRRYIHIV